MATSKQSQGGGMIVLTIIVSLVLMMIPMPAAMLYFRPEFVLLTLIYWAMATPQRLGIGMAWFTGLLMDVLMGGGLGIMAFAYALVIYLVLQFHLQLRQYPVWQQGLYIFSFVLLLHIILVLASPRLINWSFWYPALSSMLIWPVIFRILKKLRRTFHVR